jgi:hypothetical protein
MSSQEVPSTTVVACVLRQTEGFQEENGQGAQHHLDDAGNSAQQDASQ